MINVEALYDIVSIDGNEQHAIKLTTSKDVFYCPIQQL
jgi:hypothetical protein